MKKDLLLADSGSTKTDWALGTERFSTQGINPFHQSEDTILAILRDELLPQLDADRVGEVLFYGSGVRPELEPVMEGLLRQCFASAGHVEAHSDLLGAARALCGQREGIACILGTGSNSCLFDGEKIVKNTPPLGYILGDEGSGAVLGLRFLNALYKGRLPQSLRADFEQAMQMTMPQVIDRVYRQPLANRWLASLSPFIHAHLSDPDVEAIVVDNFRDFICRNIAPYDRKDLAVNAVGSIAHFYKPQLAEAVAAEGYTLGIIKRSPLDNIR
jgi:N-acetylglucosamine kinase-like BadF-type ATPase